MVNSVCFGIWNLPVMGPAPRVNCPVLCCRYVPAFGGSWAKTVTGSGGWASGPAAGQALVTVGNGLAGSDRPSGGWLITYTPLEMTGWTTTVFCRVGGAANASSLYERSRATRRKPMLKLGPLPKPHAGPARQK